MNRAAIFLFFTLVVMNILPAQNAGWVVEKNLQQKVEEIFIIQDRRVQNSERLTALLSDQDPHIRMLAVRSLGSMKDTTFLPQLIHRFVSDPDQNVRFTAAFAIGQTAAQLSLSGRRKIESDLLTVTIDQVSKNEDRQIETGRLIEEIGKFGTIEGLNEILAGFGSHQPVNFREALSMSIARFAIRGIKSGDAIDFLLNYVHSPGTVDWRIVYALQRIGDHARLRPFLKRISLLYKNQDPLVRMNLAVLFGNIKNSDLCSGILRDLAESDGDWRVRVSAFNALGRYDSLCQEDIIGTYFHAFTDQNVHVAVAALKSFGNTGFSTDTMNHNYRKVTDLLVKIAKNTDKEYPWQLQAEAISAVSKRFGENALTILTSIKDPAPGVESQIAEAMGSTGSVKILSYLLDLVNIKDVAVSTAALTGLTELSKKNPENREVVEKTYNAAIRALEIPDIAITATAAGILGDSIFIRESSVEPLMKALRRYRIPDDVEAIQAVMQALGAIKSSYPIEDLRLYLGANDRSVRIAARSAIISIMGENFSLPPDPAVESSYTDYDFQYYWSLPETVQVSLETSCGNMIINLYKEIAPFTTLSFLRLAVQKKFYSGTIFHRVVPNFVVQGGDPRGDGWGGPGYSVRSEFSELTYETGVVGMASAGMDTEGSQFFITHSPQPHLDGRYTIFGNLVAGLNVLDCIQRGDTIREIKILGKAK